MSHTDKDMPWRLAPKEVTPREEGEDSRAVRTPKFGYHKKTARLMRSVGRCGGAWCKCILRENSRTKEKRGWKKEVLISLS
jgi:hypothetical protein